MTERIIKEIPSDVIVFVFVSGLCLLLLTSFYYSPTLSRVNWLNPFYQNSVSDALGSLALTTVFSFILGIPNFLCKRWITGNGGWVDKIKGKPKEKIKEPTLAELKEFFVTEKKIKATGVKPIFNYLNFKYQIVNGAIIGSEVAVLINTVTSILLVLLHVYRQELFNVGLNEIIVSCMFIAISIGAFIIFWQYDKKYFKKVYKDQTEKLMKTVSLFDSPTESIDNKKSTNEN